MNFRYLTLVAVLVFAAVWPCRAHAEVGVSSEALALLAENENQGVTSAIGLLRASDADAVLPLLQALREGRLLVDQSKQLLIKSEDGLISVPSGAIASPHGATQIISLNNVSRRAVDESLAQLGLLSKNLEGRRSAARKLSEYPDEKSVELMRKLIADERDEEVSGWMALAIAKVDLGSELPERRVAAARVVADAADISLEADLLGRVGGGKGTEKDPVVRQAMLDALRAVQARIFWINVVSNTVYGFSLGSVLVLAALGLAITFGLMRVINMAHGEMLMLGAYSTFFVRQRVLESAPAAEQWYLLFAVPFAFATTFLMGVLLERLVIRHLYGRPLETLLATWGLSLILIQLVRVTFGAQNVTVANPDWLSGGWEALPALVIPYSRIAVLVFTALVVGFVWFVLRRTSVGLKVRAVTQNREIASSLGIPTQRIDMWTFGLGSGLAGLGGVALSQLGNVGPELGQQHIIDSFMVVVLGGVGNILGTVTAGAGLGLANKVLEPSLGAVLAKIMLLALLIAFIQWRPQGLFALKGRAAEN